MIGIEELPQRATHPQTPSADGPILRVPPNAPQVRPNRFARWLGRTVLKLGGWRMVGELPNVRKVVLIGAPHSSNWDGIWGFAAKLALGLDIHILAKKELFFWPAGPVLRALGVIEIDRKASGGFVGQTVNQMKHEDAMWIGIAPEGTRKRVTKWKSGFWKIAHEADVPVLLEYFHYPEKIIGFGPTVRLTDNFESDMARILSWYSSWQGKNRRVTS